MYGPSTRGDHDQHEQAEGEAGDRIFADDVARVLQRGERCRSIGALSLQCADRSSLKPHARIDDAVENVDQQIERTYMIAMVSTKPCTGAKSEAISASTA